MLSGPSLPRGQSSPAFTVHLLDLLAVRCRPRGTSINLLNIFLHKVSSALRAARTIPAKSLNAKPGPRQESGLLVLVVPRAAVLARPG